LKNARVAKLKFSAICSSNMFAAFGAQ